MLSAFIRGRQPPEKKHVTVFTESCTKQMGSVLDYCVLPSILQFSEGKIMQNAIIKT